VTLKCAHRLLLVEDAAGDVSVDDAGFKSTRAAQWSWHLSLQRVGVEVYSGGSNLMCHVKQHVALFAKTMVIRIHR
jgi:hypothetical protein